jgi:hypothetical protein
MNWAYEKLAMPRTIRQTMELLLHAQAKGEKVLLFGGLIQLHIIAQTILAEGDPLRLAPGSLMGTGGGLKELYPFTPQQIREDLSRAITQPDGQPLPLRDVYGMAEGNWAAMQCEQGNYHIPPWVYAVTLDGDDRLQRLPDAEGMLAFYDPYGGSNLFPAFFKTADRVRLVNPAWNDPDLVAQTPGCPCGDPGAFLRQDSIQRVDLVDEAGCAAQV